MKKMTSPKKRTSQCSGNICPCKEKCPLQAVLEAIGGKWKIPILCALHNDGPLRYNLLQRKIRGITNTMLASSLRELAEAGLIERVQYPEMPVRVEYSATPAVGEIAPVLRQLARWGMEKLT